MNPIESRDELLNALVLAVTGKPNATITDQIAALGSVTQLIANQSAEISTLKANAQTATQIATAQCAKVGVAVAPITAEGVADAASLGALDEIRAQIAKEKDPVKLGQLVAQASALREKNNLL